MMRLGSAAEWRRWFLRGWPLWLSVLLACGGLAFWQWAPHTVDTVRRLGFAYEAFGALAVLFALFDAMKRHGVDWPPVRLGEYLLNCPLWRPPANTDLGPLGFGVTLTGHAPRVTVSLRPDATPEQRIAFLERQFKAMDDHLHTLNERMRAEAAARATALADQAGEVTRQAAQVAEAIKGIEVGGLKLSLLGLLWLVVGMVLTTGTPEVCRWLLYCVP